MRGWGRTGTPDSDEASDAEVRDRFARIIGPTSGEFAATPAVFVSTQDQLTTVDATSDAGLGGPDQGCGAAPAGVNPGCVNPGGVNPGCVNPGCVNPGGVDPDGADPDGAGSGGAGLGGAGLGGAGPSRASAAALAAFDPGRRGVRAIAIVAVVVAVVAGFLAWQSRSRAQLVPSRAQAPAVSVSTAASQASVVVAVAGKVRRPGLVRLPSGARVADAIEAAGGMLPDADVAYLNLARKLADGELVLVGVAPSASMDGAGGAGAAAGASTPGGKVNLNTAGLTELQSLPGIGPVLAQRILDYRAKHGPFASPADLRKVEGIGNARFDQLKELISV